MSPIAEWLATLELPEYSELFAENNVEIDILPDLTDQDPEQLGTSLGRRGRVLGAIRELGANGATRHHLATEPPRTLPDYAERRHLTVMFIDLVGSTALSTRLDPEDLCTVIRAYHRCVTETIARFEGFVANYMGDGVLAYFGYPLAHEDDVERALHCALALADVVPNLPADHVEALQVRIGIATGIVVVADLIGSGEAQERGAVGETPNLAARLQTFADPGKVVISQNTRRLAGGLFEYRDLGALTLNGFPQPARAWQVVAASGAESRFEARHKSGLTSLVGRKTELRLLRGWWRDACGGKGRVVLLSGDPGIGKSRLTDALQSLVEATPHTRIRNFCSPYRANSAFFPVIRQLERAAGFKCSDTSAQKLAKLESICDKTSAEAPEEIALLSDLLSIHVADRSAIARMSPQERTGKTLKAILMELESLARRSPVLLIYEDVHWADPSTRQLLDLTIERIPRLSALMVMTFRPDF
ncbi:MAG: AAA family ATPase [Hyphomicrobiales bacterium]|nr:AAA family ATPase [Hyphomicrobiales bacterium]